MPRKRFEETSAWLDELSATPLVPMLQNGSAAVLANGSSWGALHALLVQRMKGGAAFEVPPSVVFFEAPVPIVTGATEDTAEWLALLHESAAPRSAPLAARAFSPDALPGASFVAGSDTRWNDLIAEVAAHRGWSWRLHLHRGLDALERGDADGAAHHLNASTTLEPNAHALRGLSLLLPLPAAAAQRLALYDQAWTVAQAAADVDPLKARLLQNLASEYAFVLRHIATSPASPPATVAAAWSTLEQWLSAGRDGEARQGRWDAQTLCPGSSSCGGQLAVARAQLELYSKKNHTAALLILRTHHFAHYQHGIRPELLGLWLDAQIAEEIARRGNASVPLTPLERRRIKFDPKRAPPAGLGAINRPHFFAPPEGGSWP